MNGAIQQKRVQHIVNSYALAGREVEAFEEALAAIIERYSSPLVEWALVESLVQNWLRYPLPRGLAFVQQIEACLHAWVNASEVAVTLTAEQFEHITGLTPPAPISAATLTELEVQMKKRFSPNSSTAG